jgi:hypothetical protein
MTMPDGLDFDRADTEGVDTVQAQPLGIGGEPLPGRYTVELKPCGCGVLVGEECDCAEFAAGLALAQVVHLPAYDLRDLRARGVTAAELHRAEHGQGAA